MINSFYNSYRKTKDFRFNSDVNSKQLLKKHTGFQSLKGHQNRAILDLSEAISHKRYKIDVYILLKTNRKSYALYQMALFQWPWMTLTTPNHPIFNRTWLRYVRVFAVAIPSVVCLSVCRLSVCNVGTPYSGGWSFRQYFFTAVYAGHPLTFVQNFTEIVLGEPLRRER